MTEVMVYPDPVSGPWMLSFHVEKASNLLDDTRPHILILLERINSDGTQTHLHIGKFPGLYAKFRNDAYFDLQVWIDDNPHLKVELPDTDLFIDLCEKIRMAALQEYVHRVCLYVISSGLPALKCSEATSLAICHEVMTS